ncbi:MAG TPA: ATP-binding cassette domain-containing protein [Candidatus Bathyarchaeia archaeon]|nr:ATP-binding cassette domain-containing protein [Candidatus Bathyarchaeia archaeon]
MSKIIDAQDLTKVYRGKVKAVDHISFAVDEGEIFGFLGPNGAGKTTTIKMLNTLASITEGKASVAGYDVRSSPGAVRKNIGVVPQELTADDELTGHENMMLMARLHQVMGKTASSKSKDLLKLVDLQDAAGRKVRTYSGGMRRRLQLVMGLLHEPKVLFLDEPTLGLDVQTRAKMWDYIKDLNRDRGLTVFMTTHYLEEADSLCDRIAIIDHGSIKVSGTPASLKETLGGDIVTLELSNGAEDLTGFFQNIEGVKEVTRTGGVYRIKLPKAEKALPVIVQEVLGKQFQIKEISFSKPTLDQVFLEVTGKSMRDEEAPQGDSGWENIKMERTR